MRLKRRLVLFFVSVIASGALSTFVLVRLSTETLFRSFVFSGDAAKAEWYAEMLGDYYAGTGSWAGVDRYVSGISSIRSVPGRQPEMRGHDPAAADIAADRVVLADGSGLVVADSSGELLGSVHPERHLSHGVPVEADGTRRGTVMVGSMVNSSLRGTDERFLLSVTASLIASTLFSASLAFLLGLAFSSRVTGPITALNAAAKKISAGDLSVVVPERGRDELTELSSSFNAMARELERLEEAKKRIIADVAHELRTPTTLIRGSLEGMLDGVFPLNEETLRSAHEETLRLSKLIDTLRELELIESGRMRLDLTDVDLLDAAERAIAGFSASAAEKRISLSAAAETSSPYAVMADPFRLNETIYNLLSNALKHAGPDGRVRVAVRGGLSEQEVILSVDDSGPGVPVEERERIFDRFYRADSSRCADEGGRGLGLAIVKEIVKAHGGTIEVGDSDLGGASFAVRLPAARPPRA